jgi:methyl-accepting chemotaxis protein
MKSLGTKVILANLAIFIVGYLSIVIALLAISQVYVVKETLTKVVESTGREAERMNSWLSAQNAAIIAASNDLMNRPKGSLELGDELKRQFESFPDFFDIYVGYSDGTSMFATEWVPPTEWDPRKRGWYAGAVDKNGEVFFSDAYVDSQTGKLCLTLAKASPDKSAVTGADIYVDTLSNMVTQISFSENSYAFLLTSSGDILSHPYDEYAPKEDTYKNMSDVDNGKFLYWAEIEKSPLGVKMLDYDLTPKYFVMKPINYTGWHLGSTIPESVAMESSRIIAGAAVAISAVLLAAAFFILYRMVRRTISKPLSEVERAAVTLASGSESIVFNRIEPNEIGSLKKAFLTVVEGVREQSEALRRLAHSDYSVRLEERSDQDVIARSINSMAERQMAYIKDITAVMKEISKGHLNASTTLDYEGDFIPIKKTLNFTTNTLKTIIAETGRVLAALSRGELATTVRLDYPGDFSALNASVNDMVSTQNSIISDISQAMARMRDGYLDGKLMAQYKGDYAPIRQSITETLQMLKGYITEI